MKRKIAFFITLIYFSILSASAQIVNPVKWTSSIEMTDGVHGTIVLSAKINSGWPLICLFVLIRKLLITTFYFI